jgi:hypothetical protein
MIVGRQHSVTVGVLGDRLRDRILRWLRYRTRLCKIETERVSL